MRSLKNVMIAGACALSVGAVASPAQAAPQGKSSGNSVAGISMKDIQEVGQRGGGGGGGGRGWGGGGGRSFSGGGGRSFSGGRGWGGGRSWGGRGFARGGRNWGGRGYAYRGYRGGYRYGRGWGYGGYWPYYAGAGLVAGAALASPYYYDDDGYGYDGEYYDAGPRRAYRGAECQVISRQRNYNGRPVKVVRYRPC